MRIGAERRKLAAERHDLGQGGGAAGVGDVPFLGRVDDVAAAPEIVKRVIDRDGADAKFVGQSHGLVHRLERDGLAEFPVGVPARDGLVFATAISRSSRPACTRRHLEPKCSSRCRRLDGVVGFDAMPRRRLGSRGSGVGFVGGDSRDYGKPPTQGHYEPTRA